MLFIRGNAISGAPIRIGTKILPNPPIRIGLTIKKIIRKACAVTTTLYSWLLPARTCTPVPPSSIRIIRDLAVPRIPENAPKTR